MMLPHRKTGVISWSLAAFVCVASLLMSAAGSILAAQAPRPAATERISFSVSEGTELSFDLSADGRTIVFDLLGELWLISAQGGPARRLTDAVHDTSEDLDPSFSPDGRQIVFKAERNGARGLWLLDLDAGRPRQLTKLPDQFSYEGNASWSRDGKTIAFARVARADSIGSEWESRIVLLDVSTRTMHDLRINGLPNPAVRDPAWAADGRSIAVVAGSARGGDGGRVWMVDIETGKATPGTPEKSRALAPVVAPDARSLAFFAPDSAGRPQVWVQDLFSLARNSSQPRRLTNSADVAPTRVRWTADGKTLLYSADGRLWRISSLGGRPSEIQFTARVAFTRPRKTLPPARFPQPGETHPARAFMGLALSPDATRIGAIALGKLWIIPVGGKAHAIAAVPSTARYMAWSADGAEVAWSAGKFNDEDLFATTVTTGATRRLTSLPGREVLPAYSPDGRHLAFVHVSPSGASILRVAPTKAGTIADTAQTQRLGTVDVSWTASNVDPPVWTPTADGLLKSGDWDTHSPTRGIVIRLSGGRDTLARFPDAPNFLQFTGRNSVIFVRHDRLWQAPFDRTGMLGRAKALGSAPALYSSASRDGTVLFISEGGLRLRTPDGKERQLGWPVSYTLPVAPPMLIRNVRIIDGTGAKLSPLSDVLVQRGRIAEIAAPGSLSFKGARVIDAHGRVAMPGLMELHAHNYRPDLLPGFLYFGVTTVRDQGSDIAPLVAYSDAINAGVQAGPRVTYGGFQFYSDWPFDEEQGRGIEPEADADHVRRSVALAEAFGAQHIKTRTFRRWDINARMIREAHRRGMRVTGHCAYQLPLVAAGMDAEEHIELCNSRGTYLSDIYMYDDIVQLFRAARIAVVPTISYLAIAARINAQPKLLDSDAELAPFRPPSGSLSWMIEIPSDGRSAYVRAAQAARDAVARLAHAGVTIGTGTDVWQIPTGVHMELEELVASGLSPAAAIRAATGDAARIIGAESNLGTIEKGKIADLVLLDANPLDDIRNTRWIWAVIQAGHIVDRNSIRNKGASIPAAEGSMRARP